MPAITRSFESEKNTNSWSFVSLSCLLICFTCVRKTTSTCEPQSRRLSNYDFVRQAKLRQLFFPLFLKNDTRLWFVFWRIFFLLHLAKTTLNFSKKNHNKCSFEATASLIQTRLGGVCAEVFKHKTIKQLGLPFASRSLKSDWKHNWGDALDASSPEPTTRMVDLKRKLPYQT